MENKSACVIVPVYSNQMTELEEFSFLNNIKVFSDRKIYIIGPTSKKMYISQLCELNDIEFVLFDDKYFTGIRGYNRLLTNIDFYKKFDFYKYMLICQLDVFVFKDDLDFWISKNLDNIGAPIFEGYTNTKTKVKIKIKGSNGGFCLRKIHSCIDVLSSIGSRYAYIRTLWDLENEMAWKLFRVIRDGLIFNYQIDFLRPVLNEDIFWSVVVPDRFPWFKNVEPHSAAYFAFDANPSYLFEFCNKTYPMAIHAWWRYDKDFVLYLIDNFNLSNPMDLSEDTNIC